MIIKRYFTDYLAQAGIHVNGGQACDIQIHDDRVYRKMLIEPSLGVGESYMAGWWDCPRLDMLFEKICRAQLDEKINPRWTLALRKMVNSFFNLQSKMRSKQVAEQHYNLGNDLYSHMLGETMSYTCAYWKQAQTLDQAQYDKFDLICRKMDFQAGDRVLDLGCGWGTLSKYIAERYGCEVVAVNISEAQVDYARSINRGLPVTVSLCDYRDDQTYNKERRLFDKVISIGLCEHVGHKNYRVFLETARRNLKEDGLFILHTIGKNDSEPYINPWIDKYIFPNGILPSAKLLTAAAEGLFVLEDLHNFGAYYDKTLMAWHHNFNEHWPLYKEQYGDTFFRMWNFYLLSCAGAFRARSMQLYQLILSPKGVRGGYVSVR